MTDVGASSPSPTWGDWCALALPVALTLAVDPGGWFPFGPAKWLVWTALVPAAGCSLLLAPVGIDRRLRAAWLALLSCLCVAATFGVEASYAWLGTPERHLGVLAWFGFAVMTAVGIRLGRSPDGPLLIARSTALAGLVLGLWGCLEMVGVDPVDVDATADRVVGPFGNAAYTGAALVLTIPVAAGVAAVDRAVWRWVAVVAAGSGAIALVGTGTRGAWIGVLAAGCLWLFVRRRAAGPATALALPALAARGVGVALALVAVVVAVTGSAAGDRVTSGFDAGLESRTAEWELGARTLADRPLLGAGPEGYRSLAPSNIDVEYAITYGRDVVPDRAHQGLLDIALAGGLVSLVAYLGLVAVVGALLWRALRCGGMLVGVLAAAGFGYFVQQQLLFPIAEIDVVWWLVLGGAIGSGSPAPPPRQMWSRAAALGLPLAVLVAAVGIAAGIVGLIADRHAADAVGALDRSPGDAWESARRAVDLRPDVVRYRVLTAATAEAIGTEQALSEAVETSEAALRWSPGDPVAEDRLVRSLALLADTTRRSDDIDTAIDRLGRRLAFDPNHPTNAALLAAVLALDGDDAESRQWLERAFALGFSAADADGEIDSGNPEP